MHFTTTPQPVDPDEALTACYGYFERACKLLAEAKTEDEQTLAAYFVKSANAEIARWSARKAEAQR